MLIEEFRSHDRRKMTSTDSHDHDRSQSNTIKATSFSELRYRGTPNDNIAFSPFERQAFHKDPNKLYIF